MIKQNVVSDWATLNERVNTLSNILTDNQCWIFGTWLNLTMSDNFIRFFWDSPLGNMNCRKHMQIEIFILNDFGFTIDDCININQLPHNSACFPIKDKVDSIADLVRQANIFDCVIKIL